MDCLQLDVTRCGGITGFLAASALAASASLDVSAHCAPNLHAQVGVAVPNLRHVEYFHDHQRIEGIFFDGVVDPGGGGCFAPTRAAAGWGWSCVPRTPSLSAVPEARDPGAAHRPVGRPGGSAG